MNRKYLAKIDVFAHTHQAKFGFSMGFRLCPYMLDVLFICF
ncbi:hypothetical protein [Bacillus albus]|nr:hypothetical protein [Bacillus albus]